MTSQEEKTDFVTAPPIQKEVDNSASNLYLLRHPREDNNTNRQRINAKLLKIGVLGVNNVGNKSEDQVMDALLKAKVVRLDNKMIPESYPDTIKEAATRLTDSKSYSWKLRLCAIEFLQNEVKDVNKHDAISASLVMLLNPLIAQCRDLRSAIVRETCNLLTLCAKNLQDKFSTIAPAVTKVLLMITGGGNKVIAGYCSECAIEIVKHTQSKKSINLFVSLCKSRSKVVREKALTCLCICLEAWSPTNWLHNTKNINNGITIGLNDPSPTAREIAKRAYEAFELHSPEDAQSLMEWTPKRPWSSHNMR